MKILLCVLLLTGCYGNTLIAEENNIQDEKSESDTSSSTKKILRKVGRKSMDETCELTSSKEECRKERLDHLKGAEADNLDTERRRAVKDAEKVAKEEAIEQKKAKQKIEEKDCYELDGKIQCAGKKIKNNIENMVE